MIIIIIIIVRKTYSYEYNDNESNFVGVLYWPWMLILWLLRFLFDGKKIDQATTFHIYLSIILCIYLYIPNRRTKFIVWYEKWSARNTIISRVKTKQRHKAKISCCYSEFHIGCLSSDNWQVKFIIGLYKQ